jgi:hypothetical protein
MQEAEGGGGREENEMPPPPKCVTFFPLYITIYSSSFILFLRFCIGVCFWVMHSGSSSSSQMMYPAFVQPPKEKKSEKE